MKTTICAEELRELGACEEGYGTFYAAHEERVVNLSEALDSNGVYDVLWLLNKLKLSEQQENDLHLLSCTYAEAVLPIYEKAYPGDNRPRKVIETKRLWVAGEATDEELKVARAVAWAAVREVFETAARTADMEAARDAAMATARTVAWGANRAVVETAGVADRASGRASQMQQEQQLKELLLSWESV